MIVFASLYYIVFCHVRYLLGACPFLMRDGNEVDPNGKGMEKSEV